MVRFWSKVIKTDSCWHWNAGKNQKGYGQFWDRGVQKKAHRVSYELRVGPIPLNKDLDHLCRNRACVNPAHLEPVERRVNVRRGNVTKLTQADVSKIRKLYKTGQYTQSMLGRQFGVRQDQISRIINFKRWMH